MVAELLVQNLMVYAGKVLADVQLDEVPCGAMPPVMAGHGGAKQFYGIVGSLACLYLVQETCLGSAQVSYLSASLGHITRRHLIPLLVAGNPLAQEHEALRLEL